MGGAWVGLASIHTTEFNQFRIAYPCQGLEFFRLPTTPSTKVYLQLHLAWLVHYVRINIVYTYLHKHKGESVLDCSTYLAFLLFPFYDLFKSLPLATTKFSTLWLRFTRFFRVLALLSFGGKNERIGVVREGFGVVTALAILQQA